MTTYFRTHIQNHFDHAAVTYDEAAVLQKEVAEHLDERLDLIAKTPETIVDLGAGTGLLTEKIHQRYPKAQVFGVDLSSKMLEKAQGKFRSNAWAQRFRSFLAAKTHKHQPPIWINADAAALPLKDASVDLIVSNLMLQWCDDLDRVFQECRRILKPEGLVLFTSLGPDTLKELRHAWSLVDGKDHVNDFIDMHDLGDALIRNGFGQPVMDVETFTLTYEKPIGVLKDLKAIGATNAFQTRQKGLMGKERFTRMLDAYAQFEKNGRVPATYEVVHGHAWAAKEIIKGPHRNRNQAVEISLDSLSVTPRKP